MAEVVTFEHVEPLWYRVAMGARRAWVRMRSPKWRECDWDPVMCEWDRSYKSGMVAEVRVIEVFKGVVGSTTKVYTPASSGGCAYPFSAGRRYVIYASEPSWHPEVELFTHACSMTRDLSEAQEAVSQLKDLATNAKK